MEKREIQRVLDVNLMGTIEVTNEFFPLIRQAKGRIVNVSSGSAVMPMTIGGYSISKIGVEAFSDALRGDTTDVKILPVARADGRDLAGVRRLLQQIWM